MEVGLPVEAAAGTVGRVTAVAYLFVVGPVIAGGGAVPVFGDRFGPVVSDTPRFGTLGRCWGNLY